MCKIKDDVKLIMKLSKIKLMKNFKVLKKTCFNPETDDPITIKEIKCALNKLKNGKAGGPDGIINEVIKGKLRKKKNFLYVFPDV